MKALREFVEEYSTPNELIRMLDSLDIITLNHSIRVCEIARYVEKELGYKDTELSEASLYHDIGKYFITTKLLNKRGKLNRVERTIIDSHSYFSYKVLHLFGVNENISLIALFHHSYSPKIYMDDDLDISHIDIDIIKKSRAIRTIDIYEALTTDRPYHRGVSAEEAIKIISSTISDYCVDTLNAIKKHSKNFE